MRYAIVSDIHANRQAWKAVLEDIQKQGVDDILCLGDVVGYGPRPADVLEQVYESCDNFILGNHDAVIGNRLDSNLFNDKAKFIIEWTRDQLSDSVADFFATMPVTMDGETFMTAHAELSNPEAFAYIFEPADSLMSFEIMKPKMLFVGHTKKRKYQNLPQVILRC